MFFRFCISITNVKHAILLLTIIIISGQMPLEIGITRFIFFAIGKNRLAYLIK